MRKLWCCLIIAVTAGPSAAQTPAPIGCALLQGEADALAEVFVGTLAELAKTEAELAGIDAQAARLNSASILSPEIQMDIVGMDDNQSRDLVDYLVSGRAAELVEHLVSAHQVRLTDARRALQRRIDGPVNTAVLQQALLTLAFKHLDACTIAGLSETPGAATAEGTPGPAANASILPRKPGMGWRLQFEIFHAGRTDSGVSHIDASPRLLRFVVDDAGLAYEGAVTFVFPLSRRGTCDMGITGTDAAVSWSGYVGHPGFRNTLTATVTLDGAATGDTIPIRVSGTLTTVHVSHKDGRYNYVGSFKGSGTAKRITLSGTSRNERIALCNQGTAR